jgi:FAD dependent oxidoreductase TIGR03364
VAVNVIIVGGGVLGTMHAWWAIQRGDEVIQIERDTEARSASVRNFGLVWVSGRRDGAELELALRARELWEQIGSRVAGVGFRPHGSLTVALDEAEAAAMKAYAASDAAAARHTEWLDSTEVRAANRAIAGFAAGALWCHSDAIVESRVALAAMRAEMAVNGRYRFIAGRRARDRSGTVVTDHLGERHAGDVVIVCTGADHDGLDADHLSRAPLRRCRLQMMQTAPAEFSLTTSIADADSMRYYPAYEHVDLSAMSPQPRVAAANKMQLLMVQRLDGGLTIGDTHSYDDDDSAGPFAFDVDEAPYRHLIERAEAILGRSLPPIERRWAGVYSQLGPDAPDGAVYHHGVIEPGVIAVTGPGGRGMTLAPAIAERTWAALDP